MDGQGHDLWAGLLYCAFYSVLYLIEYLWQRFCGRRGRGAGYGGGDDDDADDGDGGGCGGCGG